MTPFNTSATLPELIAQLCGFKLRTAVTQDQSGKPITMYFAKDWVLGLSNDQPKNIAYNMLKKKLVDSQADKLGGISRLDIISSTDGKPCKADFVTELLLYVLAMECRISPTRRADLFKLILHSPTWMEYQASGPGFPLNQFELGKNKGRKQKQLLKAYRQP